MTNKSRKIAIWVTRASPFAAGVAVYKLWEGAFVWLYGLLTYDWVAEAAAVNSAWPALIVGLVIEAIILLVRNSELRARLRPRMEFQFDPADQDCRKPNIWKPVEEQGRNTPKTDRCNGISIRLRVANPTNEPAIGCEGFITKIEFKNPNDESFQRLALYEPHRIPWALDEYQKVNISPGVPKYLGIVVSRENLGHFFFRPQVASNVTQKEFSNVGDYRFYGSVAAKTGGAAHFLVGIRWNGDWDEIQACLEEST